MEITILVTHGNVLTVQAWLKVQLTLLQSNGDRNKENC